MTSTITSQFLINSSHYKGGNRYIYTLPQGKSIKLTNNHSVAVSSCSIYNSTFNIKSSWSNNKMVILSNQLNLSAIPASFKNKGNSYTDPISGITINQKYVEIEVLDGYWDIPSLDAYFQQQCQLMGLYLASTDGGSNYYFLEALTNAQLYSCQVNLYLIPSSLPTGYVLPSGACFTLPSTASTLQIYFPSAPNNSKYGNLGRIFGFKPDVTLPLSPNTTSADSQNLSQQTPVVSPISTYLLACNLVKNDYAIPDDILLQLNLGSSKFGGIVPYNDYPQYVTCQNQMASSIVITLYDESYNALEINDSQFSLVLSIKEELQRPTKNIN